MDIDMKKVQALIDKEEIREVILKVSRGLDRHDYDLLNQAFHTDAVEDHGTFIGQARQFFPFLIETPPDTWDAYHHLLGNQTVELTDDTAHAETYLLCVMRQRKGPIDVYGGRYIDRLERREGRWAIATRVFVLDWNGEMAKGANFDPGFFVAGSWGKADPSYSRPLQILRPNRDPSAPPQ
jgi:hypothetical protein